MSKKIIATLGILGFLASAGVAFAQTATAPAAPTQPMVLQVGPAGKALLRGTVSSASASSVTIKSWGGDWTVNVGTTANVLPQGTAVSDFKVGDFVGVQGTIDSSASWTVDATLIRDWTARQAMSQEVKTNVQAVHQVMSAGPRTVQGTISSLDATAQTFTLTTTGGTAYSVSFASGAKILAKNWATLDLSKASNGDTVRVYGTIASSAITASVFRDISVK